MALALTSATRPVFERSRLAMRRSDSSVSSLILGTTEQLSSPSTSLSM